MSETLKGTAGKRQRLARVISGCPFGPGGYGFVSTSGRDSSGENRGMVSTRVGTFGRDHLGEADG